MADDPTIGFRPDGTHYLLPLSTCLRHGLVTGTSGFGKSAWLLNAILQLFTKHPGVRICILDPKGELVQLLREHFLPALSRRYPRFSSERILCIEPFGPNVVGLNPLAPDPALHPRVQAYLAAVQCDALVEGGLGPRMRDILVHAIQVVLAVGHGSFEDVRQLLRDRLFRRRVATMVADPALVAFLTTEFDEAPQASVDALTARLDLLLLVPQLASALCAKPSHCLQPGDLLSSDLTLIDLSGAPRGCEELVTYMGALLYDRIAADVFSRSARGEDAPTLVIVDEWLQIAHATASDTERLYRQARSFGVGFWLVAQDTDALSRQPTLRSAVENNIVLRVAFNPRRADLDDLLRFWQRGATVADPRRPDRILSRSELLALAEDDLARALVGYAVVVDHNRRTSAVVRSPGVPYTLAREAAAALPPTALSAFRRGKRAVPFVELAPSRIAPPELDDEGAVSDPKTSRRRPKLELP